MGNIISSFLPSEPQKTIQPRKFRGKPSTPVVLLYSYVGSGYHGLQFQPGVPTIEAILLEAIINAGLIPPNSYNSLNSINWHEASRTDVGVHAAAQVVSFRVSLPDDFKVSELDSLIEEYLPPNSPITLWKTTTFCSMFDAQRFAEGRRYHYLMPLHALKEPTLQHFQYVREHYLNPFIGNKNYHNFTKRKDASNKSAYRVIWEFSMSDPFDVNGEPYVLWTIHGQSFMMNQIRKMIATVVSLSHELITIEELEHIFTLEKWCLPIFPGDGLFLDKVEYNGLVAKYRQSCPQWDFEFNECRPLIESWKKTVLYPAIAKVVNETDIFRKWVNNILKEFPPHSNNDPRFESKEERKQRRMKDCEQDK